MIHLDKPVIVEGKYDKIKLENFLDAVIIETDGFRIFSDREKRAFIKHMAATKGIIVMTDSDSAGFRIRNFIRNIASGGEVINVYIPDVFGKEKRKTEASKEGKLGVEGLSREVLTEALTRAGVFHTESKNADARKITVTDLFEDGFTGCDNSRERKEKLLKSLSLPAKLSNTQLLKLMNTFMTYEDYRNAVNRLT